MLLYEVTPGRRKLISSCARSFALPLSPRDARYLSTRTYNCTPATSVDGGVHPKRAAQDRGATSICTGAFQDGGGNSNRRRNCLSGCRWHFHLREVHLKMQVQLSYYDAGIGTAASQDGNVMSIPKTNSRGDGSVSMTVAAPSRGTRLKMEMSIPAEDVHLKMETALPSAEMLLRTEHLLTCRKVPFKMGLAFASREAAHILSHK